MNKELSFFSIISLLFSGSLIAQTIYTEVPTTTAPFLKSPIDVIQSAMGNAGIATDATEYAPLVNIAKIPFSKSTARIAATYSPWLKDIGASGSFISSVSGYKQFDKQQAVSFAFRYNGLGTAQFADANGNNLDQFNPYELSLEAGYSQKLNDNIALGITLKYINSALGKGTIDSVTYKSGNGIATDVSFLSHFIDAYNNVFALGAVLSNLGSKITYTSSGSKSFLPANLGIGASYKVDAGNNDTITIACDINKLLVSATPTPTNHYMQDSLALVTYSQKSVLGSIFNSFADGSNQLSDLRLGCGLEYGINQTWFFRVGYSYESKSIGGNKYFTTGLGTHFGAFGADMAYVIPSGTGLNRSPLANTFRIGINVLL